MKNWNVIATTNMAGFVVERPILSPYGGLKIEQMTGHGDTDGDGDVDFNDFPFELEPITCTDRACLVRDLDFDGDYDLTDRTLSDSLPQGVLRRAGLTATATDQPFAHQGLLFEPEVGQYQNRFRQYIASARRFAQRDPLATRPIAESGYQDGMDLYGYLLNSPTMWQDAYGLCLICTPAHIAWGAMCSVNFAVCVIFRDWNTCCAQYWQCRASGPACCQM